MDIFGTTVMDDEIIGIGQLNEWGQPGPGDSGGKCTRRFSFVLVLKHRDLTIESRWFRIGKEDEQTKENKDNRLARNKWKLDYEVLKTDVLRHIGEYRNLRNTLRAVYKEIDAGTIGKRNGRRLADKLEQKLGKQ